MLVFRITFTLLLSFHEQCINLAFLTIFSLFKTVAIFTLSIRYKSETNKCDLLIINLGSGNTSEKACKIS